MLMGKIHGVDIRTMGSGNAGGTNALRSVGPLFALGVIFIDIGKGIFAVLIISKLVFINELLIDKNNRHPVKSSQALENGR